MNYVEKYDRIKIEYIRNIHINYGDKGIGISKDQSTRVDWE